jgi:hypothetical protein
VFDLLCFLDLYPIYEGRAYFVSGEDIKENAATNFGAPRYAVFPSWPRRVEDNGVLVQRENLSSVCLDRQAIFIKHWLVREHIPRSYAERQFQTIEFNRHRMHPILVRQDGNDAVMGAVA